MKKEQHIKNIRSIAADGIVLLENNGVLPLEKSTRVAAFGSTMYFCNKSGCGSGDVFNIKPVQPYDALVNNGIKVDENIAKIYKDFLNKHYGIKLEFYNRQNVFANKGCTWLENLDEPEISDQEITSAATASDVAVVSIGRTIGENFDLKLEKGSYYLKNAEIDLVNRIKQKFKKIVLVLNTTIVIDPKAIKSFGADAVLFSSMGGSESGNALYDILFGNVSPSGKLAATVDDIYNFPTNEKFGELQIPYNEGIYVGYRYFDSFGKTPIYPFGYGLSYTKFDISHSQTTVNGTKVTVTVKVQNIGNHSGKEVVELYLSEPNGKLLKAYQQLVAFKKTDELKVGEREELELCFDLRDVASFDEKTAEFILEKGNYYLRLGNCSRGTKIISALVLDKNVCCFKTVNRCSLKENLNLITPINEKPIGYIEEQTEKDNCLKIKIDADSIKTYTPKPIEFKTYDNIGFFTLQDVKDNKCSIENFVAQLSIEEIAAVLNGVLEDHDDKDANIGNMSKKIQGAAGETWSSEKYRVRSTVNADGPAGIRLGCFLDDFNNPQSENCLAKEMNAYPMATTIANSWNPHNALMLGRGISSDMEVCNIDGWLAPAMNIQRNPRCGRNFEYYSEDPLISGKMAAATVVGIQVKENGESSKRYATIKHLSVNNAENNRLYSNSIVSERALREIYLKGFEIAAKESKPHAVMNSYNMLNGEYTSNSYDLNVGILRQEWEYDGCVMTDWGTKNDTFKMTNAGCDLVMPGGKNTEFIEGIKDGRINIDNARTCAVNVLKLLLKTNI